MQSPLYAERAAEGESPSPLMSTCPSQYGSSTSTPNVPPPENPANRPDLHMSGLGTVIPNRVFVGGISYKVNERELQHFFSQHGAVKEVKIVINRSGLSKGYGFVTFENQEDALKILNNANGICFKDRELIIRQAVRRQQYSGQIQSVHVASSNPAVPLPVSCGTLYVATSTGYPYTYHDGAAYFHCTNPPAHQWPPFPPVMFPHTQPVYQQPAHLYNQCVPNQHQWTVAPLGPPMPSGPVVYSQLPEHLYQPPDGVCVLTPLPVAEDAATTEFVEPALQQFNQVYPQRAEGMTPIVLPHNPGKNLMPVHPKPMYHRHIHHKDFHYLPEATEPPDTTMFHAVQPLM